jgi:hypothetical protein
VWDFSQNPDDRRESGASGIAEVVSVGIEHRRGT